jgi:transposase
MAARQSAIAVIGIDIGKNSFHVVGLDSRGAIVLRQKWSRGQIEARFANMSACLIGMEACVGAHHLSRKLKALGHDARLMPARSPWPGRTRASGLAFAKRISPRRQHVAVP